MATGISPELKDKLWAGVQELMMGKEVYEKTLQDLETKNNEPTPQAKNAAFQDELTKTHTVYKQTIQRSIDNIKAQYTIGQELKGLFEQANDLQEFGRSLNDLQTRLIPLLEQHKKNAPEIASLENHLVELMSSTVAA